MEHGNILTKRNVTYYLANISLITNEFSKYLFMERTLFKWFPSADISIGDHKYKYFTLSLIKSIV